MSDSECRLRKRAMWMQAYSTILAGLCANTEIRLSWPELRERAKTEANVALLEAEKVS